MKKIKIHVEAPIEMNANTFNKLSSGVSQHFAEVPIIINEELKDGELKILLDSLNCLLLELRLH